MSHVDDYDDALSNLIDEDLTAWEYNFISGFSDKMELEPPYVLSNAQERTIAEICEKYGVEI